jgi:hypothetical protein
MGFFQAPPVAQVRRDLGARRLLSRRRPVDERRSEFGRTVAINRLLFRNDHAALYMPAVTVYSDALDIELELIVPGGELNPKNFGYGPHVLAALRQHGSELSPTHRPASADTASSR